MQEKSENFNSLRPTLFELCKKKTTGGVKLPLPPAGIGLKSYQSLLKYLNKNIFKLKAENLFFFKAESSSGFNLETINDSRLDADQLLDRKGVNIWMKIILFINFYSF